MPYESFTSPIHAPPLPPPPPSKTPISSSTTTTSSSLLHASLTHTPPLITSASGLYLTTSTGTRILDATGGAAVACLGHAHPRIRAALEAQLASGVAYIYAPFFSSTAAEELATRLVGKTPEMARVFVVSSGTEAVEAGLKLARQYWVEREGPRTPRGRFVAREGSYHGNTLGALGVGGHVGRKAIYGPLLGGNVSWVRACYPYRGLGEGEGVEGYVARLKRELEDELVRVGPETVCGFVAETMSGMTLGAVPPVPGYLKAMKEVCDKYGVLFILDEVMSGMGRTGTLHAWEQEGVVPHLQTVAKGLGAGYEPIGALLVHKSVVDVLESGTKSFVHSQTYQGHPMACAAALEVQKVIEEENLLENVQTLGPILGELLRKALGDHQYVGDIRGRGFMWAVEFVQDRPTKAPFPAAQKVAASIHATGLGMEDGISLLPGGGVADGINGDVIMLAPPYNSTEEDLVEMVERTGRAVRQVLG